MPGFRADEHAEAGNGCRGVVIPPSPGCHAVMICALKPPHASHLEPPFFSDTSATEILQGEGHTRAKKSRVCFAFLGAASRVANAPVVALLQGNLGMAFMMKQISSSDDSPRVPRPHRLRLRFDDDGGGGIYLPRTSHDLSTP